MDNNSLVKTINSIANVLKENRAYLTDLDQAIGDGDHGINLDRGFSSIVDKIEDLHGKDCGTILTTIAMILISKVGGASGPLYGTAFMRAGQIAKGKYSLNNEDGLAMFDAAISGIISRGKASRGDKTMLDTLIPAYEAYKAGVEDNLDKETLMQNILVAAKNGVDYTKTIAAKKGRANYLGDRSIGHQDPGATSSYLVIKTIIDNLAD